MRVLWIGALVGLTPLSSAAQTVSTIELERSISADGLALDKMGRLWIASGWDQDSIHYVDLASGAVTEVEGALDGPIDVAASPDGSIWVTNWRSARLSRVDGASAVRSTAVGPKADDLAFAPDSSIWVTSGTNRSIRRLDPDGSSQIVYRGAPLDYPYGVTITPTGQVYVASAESGQLHRVDEDGSLVTIAEVPDSGKIGSIVWARGRIYGTGLEGHNVWEIDLDGSVISLAGDGVAGARDGSGVAARFNAPMGIAVSVDETKLYVMDIGVTDRVRVIDISQR